MEDSPSSSASSTLKENRGLLEQNENNLRKLALHPSASLDGIRRPFRQLGGGLSPSAAFSSAEINCRKKSAIHKLKNSGAQHGKRIKIVFVGDIKTGKTALVQRFLGQSMPDYVPTTEDVHMHTSMMEDKHKNGKKVETTLQISDIGGQEEMDRFRPLCYGQVKVVVICFSVMNPASFANVTQKWLPEIKRHCMVNENPENPTKLLLVGTQSDLRSNVNLLLKLMDDGQAPISETQALRLASKIGAFKYVECSAITGNNINHIFDLAMTYGSGKKIPKQLKDLDSGFQGKILPNLTERKLLFWRRWRFRQTKSSKMKRLVLLPCMF